jgi:hypothetical protein
VTRRRVQTVVIGLVILVIALVAFFDGKLPVAYRPPPARRSSPSTPGPTCPTWASS